MIMMTTRIRSFNRICYNNYIVIIIIIIILITTVVVTAYLVQCPNELGGGYCPKGDTCCAAPDGVEEGSYCIPYVLGMDNATCCNTNNNNNNNDNDDNDDEEDEENSTGTKTNLKTISGKLKKLETFK